MECTVDGRKSSNRCVLTGPCSLAHNNFTLSLCYFCLFFVACSSNCAVCSSSTVCTSCISGKYLYLSACDSSCPSGTYISGSTCSGFPPVCKNKLMHFLVINCSVQSFQSSEGFISIQNHIVFILPVNLLSEMKSFMSSRSLEGCNEWNWHIHSVLFLRRVLHTYVPSQYFLFAIIKDVNTLCLIYTHTANLL